MAKQQGGYLGWIIALCLAALWFGSDGNEQERRAPSAPDVQAVATKPVASGKSPDPVSTYVLDVPPAIAEIPATAPASPSPSPTSQVPEVERRSAVTANVRLRTHGSTEATIITTLPRGTEIIVLDATGTWFQVRVPSGELVGWVRGDYVWPGTTPVAPPLQPLIASPRSIDVPPTVKAQRFAPEPSTRRAPEPVRRQGDPIREPRSGSCDCPYDYARNGSRCGGRSAYSRPGGRSPVCYVE